MNTRSLIATLAVCATAIAIAALVSEAGPLNPPPGPVAPTNKTLSDVEPRIPITSENLTGNANSLFWIRESGSYYLTGNIVGVAGKHGIQIDADGVSIDLNGFELRGVPASDDGVFVGRQLKSIHIRNGSIRGWSGAGVNAEFAQNSSLRDVLAADNEHVGLRIGDASIVERCAAQSNGATGILAGRGSIVSRSTAFDNDGTGIFTSSRSTITYCSVWNNDFDGIGTTSGSTLIGNTADSNKRDGIQATSSCYILNNTCTGNGRDDGDGAGIHITSRDNRIEANHVIGNDRGIEADLFGNLILQNSASGNDMNFDVVSGNVCLVFIAQLSGPVQGSVGGASPATNDPWANLSLTN